jgi:hypothetical protein
VGVKGLNWESHTRRADQLEIVERMGRESIGDAHPSTATLSQRLAINPDVLQVFGRRYSDGHFELRGYWLLYPITDEAGGAIAEGRIRHGKELGVGTLLPDFGDAKYLYIGMLLGTPDLTARSHAKAYLREELARRIADGKVELVYGRPANPSGLRLLRDYGFAAIADERDIWSVSGERLMRNVRLK